MTKGLMDRSLHQELALEMVREKAKLAEEKLFEVRNWKVVMEQKLKLAERARDEYQKMTEELKKALEDKENDVRQAREKAVQEYRDSNALISELRVCYNDGFDDALRQAKALYPKLDFSSVNITLRRQRPFILTCRMIRTSFLRKRCPAPSFLKFNQRKKRPVKPKIPSFLTCRHNYLLFPSILKTIWILPVVCRAVLYSLY